MHIGDERIATSQGGGVVDVTGGAVRPVQDPNRGQYKNEQQALGAVAQALATVQDQVDDAKTLEKDNQAVEAINNELTNFESLKGQAAINAKDEYSKKIETIKTDLSQGLDNNMQRQMLEKVLSRRLAMANGRIGKHYAQQSSVYKAGQLKARADNTVNEAVSHLNTYGKPGGAYNQSKIHLLTTVDEIAEVGGLGPEQKAVLKRTATTGLHTLSIKKLVSESNGQGAKAYLEDNRNEIDEKVIPQLNQLVEEEFFKDETLNISKEVQGKFPGIGAQIDEIDRRRTTSGDDKISDKLYASLRSNLISTHNFNKARRAEWNNSVVRTATRWADDNRDKSLAEMPTDLVMSLKNTGKYSSMARYMKTGRHVTDDPGVFVDIINSDVLKGMTEEQFEDNFRTKLSAKDYDYANKLRHDINTDKNSSQLVSTKEVIKQTAIDLDIIPAKGSLSEGEKRNMYDFTTTIQGLVQSYEDDELGGKRKANNKEVEQIISDELTRKAKVGGFFGMWKTEVPVISIPLDEQEHATIELESGEEITLKELAAVKEQIIKYGGTDTEDPKVISEVYGIMAGHRGGIIPAAQGSEVNPYEQNRGITDIPSGDLPKVLQALGNGATQKELYDYWEENKGVLWD